ncbi:transglycosylase-like protein with SLT domain [Herbihabitans rhizosphaerae]|uniref:Transglycosylase-like protein with SLT domain n=1 Tax=Herbihabitans rhizosphaerae TaxID=1872711 RepID=A0A4Q7KR08_9PSEU|nr:transglycosylase SLT domain-containing protein [Herbihabitans rhizosphaerae]RZS38914.1 transglycosylase-like protein with SLT domain [Herbihabitans rhizosphaerae]
MSTLSAQEIAQYAYDAGFRGRGLTTAVAVAFAESGGNPRAHNSTPPDNSYGLWQINMLGDLGPARRDEFNLKSNRQLFNPARNAKAANKISSDGTNWQPWTTYTSGAYKQFLGKARKAARAVSRSGGHAGSATAQSGGAKGDGFTVNTPALEAYAKRAGGVGDDLRRLGKTHLEPLRETGADSFGQIGRETGFLGALNGFTTALQRQVKVTGSNVDRLGTKVATVARDYRGIEDDIEKLMRKSIEKNF